VYYWVCIKCYKKCDLYTHKVIPRPQVNRPMLTSPQTSNANSWMHWDCQIKEERVKRNATW